MGLLMIIEKRGVICLCLVLFGLFQVSLINGEVYRVGDDAGWTIIGNVNYTNWADNKSFQLDDVIMFEYNPEFHNVIQVIPAEYKSCEVSAPIATYTSGNDSVAIKTEGHHFFVCGVAEHCAAGQKVDINVRAAAAPSPSATSPPGSTTPPPPPPSRIPARPRNDARPNNYMPLGWVVVQLSMLAGVLFSI